MNKITTWIVTAGCLAFAPLHAQDSILKNGNFEEPDINNYQKGWFQHSAEPSSDEWVKIVYSSDGGGAAVEIRSGPPERYLCQDVKIKEGESGNYVLRWRAKGEGTGSVLLLPRDLDNTLLKSYSEKFLATHDFELYEIPVTIPEDAVNVRVFLMPQSPDSVITFSQIELVPTSASK
jgi:hypothetical protein